MNAFDPLGLPAPLWLLYGLKVFGFWLHMIFMNLWFAGLPIGLLLANSGGDTSVTGTRLLRGMPVFIAFGINAGVVPLLFMQVLYPQFFYTTTILQAWAWAGIIALVLVAYYATYVYVLAKKAGRSGRWVDASGWLAALIFLVVGAIFTSEMQLLTRPTSWQALASSSTGGTVSGFHLALSASAVTRYFMMFGMALGTTAAYIALDANFLGREPDESEGAKLIVLLLAFAGVVVFVMGAQGYNARIGGLSSVLGTARIAAYGPAAALAAAALYFWKPRKLTALVLVAVQLASLAANAIARQSVQAREIARYFDVRSVPVHFQLSPVILFALTLLAGLAVVGWLLLTYVRAGRAATPSAPRAAAQPAVYR